MSCGSEIAQITQQSSLITASAAQVHVRRFHRLTGGGVASTSPKLFSTAALLDWSNADEGHCGVFKALH